jgi:antitoxin ParD1/3/4
MSLTPELAAMRDKVVTGLYSSPSEVGHQAVEEEEKDRFNKIKLDQLRNDIQAGIASGDAGTLDADKIKRRGRVWHGDALRETERRYEAGQEQPAPPA